MSQDEEKEIVSTVFSEPTKEDYDEFTSAELNADACLEGRIKASFTDRAGNTADLFIDTETYERLGEAYISANTVLRYETFIEQWRAKLSENNYYNDLTRNPEKVISLVFDSIDPMTGREVYQSKDSKWIYTREVSRREPFARWMSHGAKMCYDSGVEVRANLVFEFAGQTEKVFYDDWNGVAAYSTTFNSKFNTQINGGAL